MSDYLSAYPVLAEQLAARGLNVETFKTDLKAQHIETPSWGYLLPTSWGCSVTTTCQVAAKS